MANVNWRTINVDALDPDSPANFDLSSLAPSVAPVSTADVQSLAGQIRQLLRGGDNPGALQGALENPPYGADSQGKVCRSMLLPRLPRNTVSYAPGSHTIRYFPCLSIVACLHGHASVTLGTGLPATGTSALTLARTHKKGNWADLCLTFLQDVHLAIVIEILQSIRQADMSPILSQIYSAPGGTEALDVLMKYMYAPLPKADTMLFHRPLA